MKFAYSDGLSLILSVWLAGRFFDRRRFADFGLRFNRSWWIDLAFGLALGAFLQAGILFIQLSGIPNHQDACTSTRIIL